MIKVKFEYKWLVDGNEEQRTFIQEVRDISEAVDIMGWLFRDVNKVDVNYTVIIKEN